MLAQQDASTRLGASSACQQLPSLPQLWPQAPRAQQQQGPVTGTTPSLSESPSPMAGDGDDAFRTDGPSDRDRSTDPVALEAALDGVPSALNVMCNGNPGIYVVARRAIQCLCGSCCSVRRDPRCAEWLVSPTEYERHSGMPAAKKWRYSIKVAHDSEPSVSLGRWLELKGLAYKIRKNAKGGHTPDLPLQSTQQQPQQQRTVHISSHSKVVPGLGVAAGSGDGSGRSEDSQQDATTAGEAGIGSCELASLEQLEAAPSDAVLSALGPAARQYSLGSYGSLGRFDPTDMLCMETWSSADLGVVKDGCAQLPVQPLQGVESGASPHARMQRMFSDDLGERQLRGQDQPVLGHVAKAKDSTHWDRLPHQQQQQQGNGTFHTACSHMDSGSDGPCEADGIVELTCMGLGLKPASAAGAPKPSPSRNRRSPRSRRSQPQLVPGDGALDTDAHKCPDTGRAEAAAGGADADAAISCDAGATPMEWQRPAALRTASPDVGCAAADDARWLRSPHPRAETPADVLLGSTGDTANNEAEGSGPKSDRVGDKYQASLPNCRAAPPRESDTAKAELARAGRPGPDEAAALEQLPAERAAAGMQPRDAVEDVWEEVLAASRERPPVPLALLERSQRIRRAPTWLAGESYVDPNKACSLGGGRAGGRGSDEDGAGAVTEDENPYAGKRQSVTGTRKRAIKDDSCDSDSGAEAEAALAHIHQLYNGSVVPRGTMQQQQPHKRARPGGPPGSNEPLLVQWQLGQYNSLMHLEATIVVNGQVFHGCLPAAAALSQHHKDQQQQQQPAEQCCELCQQPAEPCDRDEEAPQQLVSKGLGALMPVALPGGQVALVHRQCALWSPEVYATSRGELANLPEAVQRGRASTCSHCGNMGATLKCWQRQCTLLFHLPCARTHGCTLLPEPYTVACPGHDPSDMSDADLSGADDLGASTANDALNNAAAVAGRASSCGDGSDQGEAGRADSKPCQPATGQEVAITCAKSSGRTSCAGGDPAAIVSATNACADGVPPVPRGGDEDRPPAADGCDGNSANACSKANRGLPCKVDYAKLARGIVLPAARPVPGGPAAAMAALAATAATSTGAAADVPGRHVMQPLLGQACLNGAAAQPALGGSTLSAQQQDMRDQGSQQPPYYHPGLGMLSRPIQACSSSLSHAGHGAYSALHYSYGTAGNGANGSSATQRMLNQALNRNFGAAPAPAAPLAAGSMLASDAATAAEHGVVADGIMHVRGLEEMWLGGTTGQPGRSGRCAVCVIQRKGKCGTESAPKKCLRRQMLSIAKSSKAKSVRARSGL